MSLSIGSPPGANKQLSNLSATAINTALIPSTNANKNLGSTSLLWGQIFVDSARDTSGVAQISFSARQLNDSGSNVTIDWANKRLQSGGLGAIAASWTNTEFVSNISFGMAGATSGQLNQKASATTTSYTVTWPSAQGTGALTNDGAGNLTWTSSGGAVTSVNGNTGVVTVNAINQLTGDVTATAASGSQSKATSLVATSNSTLATLSALSLPVTQLTGTLGVPQGGTGQTTYTDGQLLIGNTATNSLSKATLTAGTNVSITNGNGSITINATGGGSAAFNVVSKTSAYTAVANDYIKASSASFIVTLPTAVGISGQQISIQHAGTSLTQVYTLNTTSAQTIGGVASGSYALYTNGEVLELVSDGANWQIVNHKTSYYQRVSGITVSATAAYVFTVTAANATIGATYSNNGFIYTVAATITGTTTLTCNGTGTPATSGTLTKVSGTGDATITFSSRTTTGQPVLATSPTYNYVDLSRDGRWATLTYKYFSPATTGSVAGLGRYIFYLPTGLSMDTSIQPNTNGVTANFDSTASAATQVPGAVISLRSDTGPGGTWTLYGIQPSSTTEFVVSYWLATGGVNVIGDSTFPPTQIVQWTFSFRIPISGWQP